MTGYYDDLEIRSPDQREAQLLSGLREVLGTALEAAPGLKAHLGDVDLAGLADRAALAQLPVLRKSDLTKVQSRENLLAGFTTRPVSAMSHVFMSPGPIFEVGGSERDWWRLGRFLAASGIGQGDIVQNCFAYHLTPAGMMFENAAAACACISVCPVPAGSTVAPTAAAAFSNIMPAGVR